MDVKVVTALSVAGVLLAAGLAAAVNASVFEDSSSTAPVGNTSVVPEDDDAPDPVTPLSTTTGTPGPTSTDAPAKDADDAAEDARDDAEDAAEDARDAADDAADEADDRDDD